MEKLEDHFLGLFNGKYLIPEDFFRATSYLLMNEYVLSVGTNDYRISELEFYYHSEINHPDIYAHRHQIQSKFLTWYFHPSGLDITFGKNGAFGGLLIRGLISLEAAKRNLWPIKCSP